MGPLPAHQVADARKPARPNNRGRHQHERVIPRLNTATKGRPSPTDARDQRENRHDDNHHRLPSRACSRLPLGRHKHSHVGFPRRIVQTALIHSHRAIGKLAF